MVNMHHPHLKIVAVVFYAFMLELFPDYDARQGRALQFRLMVAYSTPTHDLFRFVLSTAPSLYALMRDPDLFDSVEVHPGYRLTDFVIRMFPRVPDLIFYEAYCYENRYPTDVQRASVYLRRGTEAFVKYFASFPDSVGSRRISSITEVPDQLRIMDVDSITGSLYPAILNPAVPFLEFEGSYGQHRDYAFRVAFGYTDECIWLLRRLRDLSEEDTPVWVHVLRVMFREQTNP